MCFLRAVCLVFLCQLWGSEQVGLDEYILDYQPLHYDTLELHTKHDRVKRSVDPHLTMNFSAYGRDFNLKLKQDNAIFSSEHRMVSDDGSLAPVDTSFIYSGTVEDAPGSYAHVAVINGTARGYVQIPGQSTYHIEPAAMYFKNPTFHTVIYPETHMDLDPFRHRRSAEVGVCGNDEAAAWMRWHALNAVDPRPDNRARRYRRETAESGPHNKYSAGSNTNQRQRRSNLGEKNTCYLYLRADPILWEHIKEKKYNTILSDERTQEEILAFFASHVSAVKNIYSKTDFRTYDNSARYMGVDFVVQRTSIMTMENQACQSSNPTRYCNRNIDVTNFLNLNSLDQHNEFCLAYIFTFRDFTKGTLGLAWVGSASSSSGGVCERHKEFPEGGQQVSKSLNTGIVTVINYGKAVPARVSQLTFAHEIGHNFGSPHDSGTLCAPYGTDRKEAEDGNYIMFASATMGDKPNNDDFSICSLDNITRVLDAVLNERYGKVNCFQKSTEAFCGNGITEHGEQCDCGYEADCQDQCCYGKGSSQDLECKLRPGKQCSPTAGPCCSRECKYIADTVGTVCQPQDDCKAQSLCGGNSASCPAAQQKPNGTFCNDYSQICYQGECVSSVCHGIAWEECFLTSDEEEEGGGPSREAMCYVSCRNPTTKRCVSSYTVEDINRSENLQLQALLMNIQQRKFPDAKSDVLLQGIQLPAGSPCDNFRGYCDVFHKCRGVDADGPLARLKNLIFDPKTLQNIKDWIVVHWWAVMLMSAGLVVVMAVFIKVCAVHTPSSNPRKSKARKLTMTLRRPHRRPHTTSQSAALTSHEQRLRTEGRGQGSRGGAERTNQQRNKPNNTPAAASSSGGGGTGAGGDVSSGGGSGGAGGATASSSAGSSGGAAAVVVEKARDPPPPYTSALLPGNPPPHGKGRRGRRGREQRGVELQRL